MLDPNEPPPAAEDAGVLRVNKVRRSIFLSEELEGALARLAEQRGMTTNDLISEILARAVADHEGGAGKLAEWPGESAMKWESGPGGGDQAR